jgi:lysophospholipase L1-like esterase
LHPFARLLQSGLSRSVLALFLASAFVILLLSTGAIRFAHAEKVTIVAHGESITAGYALANPDTQAFPALLRDKLNASGLPVSVLNLGNSGAGFSFVGAHGSTLAGEAPSIVDNHAGPKSVLILLMSSNEMHFGKTSAQAFALFEAYVSARLRAGFLPGNMIVCPILPRPTVSENERSAYNSPLIAAQDVYGYRLARLDQSREIGQAESYKNTMYWDRDQVHPNALGHQIMARVIYPVLSSIVLRLESATGK